MEEVSCKGWAILLYFFEVLCKSESVTFCILTGILVYFALLYELSFIFDLFRNHHFIILRVNILSWILFLVVVVIGSYNMQGSAFEVFRELVEYILAC